MSHGKRIVLAFGLMFGALIGPRMALAEDIPSPTPTCLADQGGPLDVLAVESKTVLVGQSFGLECDFRCPDWCCTGLYYWEALYDAGILQVIEGPPGIPEFYALAPGTTGVTIKSCDSLVPWHPCGTSATGTVTVRIDPRSIGDFDDSGCTDIGDFLFLLDHWTLPYQGTPVGLNDYLNLLDNWHASEGC